MQADVSTADPLSKPIPMCVSTRSKRSCTHGSCPGTIHKRVTAAASISSAGVPVPQQIATLAIFVIIASLGVFTPLAVYLIMGERAKALLGSWRNWAAQHNAAILAVLFFVLGLKLIGDGIGILAT